jgi:hypothetical protein
VTFITDSDLGQASVAESSVALPLATEDSQMTFSEYTLENSPINIRQACPECSALMYLARIEPEKPGFDLRTFECPRCQHVETVAVKFG